MRNFFVSLMIEYWSVLLCDIIVLFFIEHASTLFLLHKDV